MLTQVGRGEEEPGPEVVELRLLPGARRRRRWLAAGVLLGATAAVGFALALRTPAAVAPCASDRCVRTELRSVVVWLSDDQNRQHMGCYDPRTTATPHLAAFARQGLVFSNAYVPAASCAPSRAAIMTGLYPLRSGVYANHYPMKPDVKTLYSVFKDTHDIYHVGKGHLAPVEKVFGDGVTYIHFTLSSDQYADEPWSDPRREIDVSRVRELLETQAKSARPFLLFVAAHFPHPPYVDLGIQSSLELAPLPLMLPNYSNYHS